jgi:hypothetical protein
MRPFGRSNIVNTYLSILEDSSLNVIHVSTDQDLKYVTQAVSSGPASSRLSNDGPIVPDDEVIVPDDGVIVPDDVVIVPDDGVIVSDDDVIV